jgi:ribose-phosphate pyrophosphokinase
MADNSEVLILADPESNVWGYANAVYNEVKMIESERGSCGFRLGEVKIARFPDGEFEPKIASNCRRREVFFISDTSQDPSRWLVELMFVNDAARRGSADKITDVFPYMRWSRGEKKDKPHIPITTKVVMDVLSAPNCASHADRLMMLDLHADAIAGFTNLPVDALHSFNYLTSYLRKSHPEIADYVIVAPDNGGVKRARAFARRLESGLEVAVIDKERRNGESVEVYNVIGDVAGRDCIIVDDILSSALTLKRARQALGRKGARSVKWVATHFLGVGNYKNNLAGLDAGFTTDSFFHTREELCGAEVVSSAPLFAEAIYRSVSGESISDLFK